MENTLMTTVEQVERIIRWKNGRYYTYYFKDGHTQDVTKEQFIEDCKLCENELAFKVIK